jgi:hypothetical protein
MRLLPGALGTVPARAATCPMSVNQDLIRHEQFRRNSEFGTSGGFESLTKEVRSYIGMNGTNGGFACG